MRCSVWSSSSLSLLSSAGFATRSHEVELDAVGADGGVAAASSKSASFSTVGDHDDDAAEDLGA